MSHGSKQGREALEAWRALDWKLREYVAFSCEVMGNDADTAEADREGFRVAAVLLRSLAKPETT